MLDRLFAIPLTGGMSSWSFDNAQHHSIIRQAIQKKTGVILTSYVLDPIPQFGFQDWLTLHQQAHSDVNGLLGTQSSDLTSLDFNDVEQVKAWFYLQWQEHQAWANILKV